MKIYVDVTETVHNRLKTGVQRVVREFIKNSKSYTEKTGVEVVPVVAYRGKHYELIEFTALQHDQFVIAENVKPKGIWSSIKGGLKRFTPLLIVYTVFLAWKMGRRKSTVHSSISIKITKDDILLLLDSWWSNGEVLNSASNYKKQGVKTIAIAYDLIPIFYPQYCDSLHTMLFTKRINILFAVSDVVISISNSVSDDVQKYVALKNSKSLRELKFDYFYLGADFTPEGKSEKKAEKVWSTDFWQGAGVFMIVGTIEPRKGHAFVLKAFEQRWGQGMHEKLLIIGMRGWKTESLVNYIENSPYFGITLFMENSLSDVDLQQAYKKAAGCIMASYTEGFGLPLVEAMQHGMPVIASDIPVFREIAQDNAIYFDLDDIDSFNHAVDSFNYRSQEIRENLKQFKWQTWQDSTEQLLNKVVVMKSEAIG